MKEKWKLGNRFSQTGELGSNPKTSQEVGDARVATINIIK